MPSYAHEECGAVLPTSQSMQAHSQACRSYGGFTLQSNAPARTLTPGARVSWEHEGVARTGMVWAEAPNIVGPKGGKGKPQRHVIPDGERHAVQVPVHKLTQLEDAITAAKAPPHLFHERRLG